MPRYPSLVRKTKGWWHLNGTVLFLEKAERETLITASLILLLEVAMLLLSQAFFLSIETFLYIFLIKQACKILTS